jgi:hypothetical protein
MVLEKRGDGSVWGYVARSGRDSYQGIHGVAQKACEPGKNCGAKLLHRDESVLVSPLDSAAVSLFFYFFPFVLIAFPFSFFSPTGPRNRDGATKRWLRDR